MISPDAPTVKKPPVPVMMTDTESLLALAKEHSSERTTAEVEKPFTYIQLASLIKPICRIGLNEAFVSLLKNQSAGRQETDVTTLFPQSNLPCAVRQILWELSSSSLIRHFATLAQTPPLIPDPFLIDAGAFEWRKNELPLAPIRHPKTQLKNILRLELFLSQPNIEGSIDIQLQKKSGAATTLAVTAGSALLMDSQQFSIDYNAENSERWMSYVLYYYVNDNARNLNGEIQPQGGY